ncbi:MAG: Uma2 family endonuclease [Spirosomaceae bacterium]|nr:Uma2 family endonuclease [Spirosomataceae bacterium]
MEAITLSFRRVEGFTDDEFYNFCLDNSDLKFERTANGAIIVMSNTGGITGDRNSENRVILAERKRSVGSLSQSQEKIMKLPEKQNYI